MVIKTSVNLATSLASHLYCHFGVCFNELWGINMLSSGVNLTD